MEVAQCQAPSPQARWCRLAQEVVSAETRCIVGDTFRGPLEQPSTGQDRRKNTRMARGLKTGSYASDCTVVLGATPRRVPPDSACTQLR